MGRLLEGTLGTTEDLASLLFTEKDIENPSVNLIFLRPRGIQFANQSTDYRLCHKPGFLLYCWCNRGGQEANGNRKKIYKPDSGRDGGEMRNPVGGLWLREAAGFL